MYIITFMFSIWQSILFWHKTPGISVILFVFPFLIFLIKYLDKNNKIKNKKAILIVIPILLLASTYFIFNNEFLTGLNKIILPALTIIMIMELICEEFTLEKAINNVLNFLMKPIGYFGLIGKNLFKKIKKDNIEEQEKSKKIKRLLKSLLISAPILLIVLVLLITADSDFANIFDNSISRVINFIQKIRLSNITSRIIAIIFIFFYFTGFMENIILTKEIERNKSEIKEKDSLSIKITLFVLNIFYLLFCIIQVKRMYSIYFINNNIDYSYYARQGFFQLMLISLINLIVILKSKSKYYKGNKYIISMDLIMLFSTAIILISSFTKMYLYQQRYGFTELRIFVFLAQITEGILIIPTLIHVLDKKIKLKKTYFTIIVIMYVILNFINIDRLIAKRNVDMYLERGSISEGDVYFLTNLSVDAIPETIRLLDLNNKEEQNYLDMLNKIEQATNEQVDESLRKDIYNDYYMDENKKILIKRLKEIYEDLSNNKIRWQEYNISEYRAMQILKKVFTI